MIIMNNPAKATLGRQVERGWVEGGDALKHYNKYNVVPPFYDPHCVVVIQLKCVFLVTFPLQIVSGVARRRFKMEPN